MKKVLLSTILPSKLALIEAQGNLDPYKVYNKYCLRGSKALQIMHKTWPTHKGSKTIKGKDIMLHQKIFFR